MITALATNMSAGGQAAPGRRVAAMALLALAACVVHAQELSVDPRFCGEPAREADGTIARSMLQRARFVRMHPCPATGQVTGACQKWAVDHVIPLACGGCDTPLNMQWLPNAIKSGPGKLPKDRWEMYVYCNPPRRVTLQ